MSSTFTFEEGDITGEGESGLMFRRIPQLMEDSSEVINTSWEKKYEGSILACIKYLQIPKESEIHYKL